MDMPVKHKKPSIAAQAAAREARPPKLPENLLDGLIDRPMSAMEVEDLICISSDLIGQFRFSEAVLSD